MVSRYICELVSLADSREGGVLSLRDVMKYYSTTVMAKHILRGLIMQGLFSAGINNFYLNRDEAKKRGLI